MGNKYLESFSGGVCTKFESARLLPVNATSSKIVLMLRISELSERGLAKIIFINSFMATPISIKKAILKPTEKRIFSDISKFLSARSFMSITPGTNKR
jgi:hypothetical protein